MWVMQLRWIFVFNYFRNPRCTHIYYSFSKLIDISLPAMSWMPVKHNYYVGITIGLKELGKFLGKSVRLAPCHHISFHHLGLPLAQTHTKLYPVYIPRKFSTQQKSINIYVKTSKPYKLAKCKTLKLNVGRMLTAVAAN